MAGRQVPSVLSSVGVRLRGFLHTLPAEACARIVEAIESETFLGMRSKGSDLIMRAVVSVMAGRRQKVPRIGNAKRYFFADLDPFLINEQLPRKWAGRIARSSIYPIWEWLCRDLVPKEMAT